MKHQYIGDGVYAVFDGYGIEIRANSLYQPSDIIYLEPDVLEALYNFYKKQFEQNGEENVQ